MKWTILGLFSLGVLAAVCAALLVTSLRVGSGPRASLQAAGEPGATEGILLVAANVMMHSVRERTSEIGVLKTLGFTDGGTLWLVLAESVFVAVIGGGLGLLVSWVLVSGGDPTGGYLPIFILPPRDVAIGAGLIVLLGVLAGLLPALGAMRLRIVDALRRA